MAPRPLALNLEHLMALCASVSGRRVVMRLLPLGLVCALGLGCSPRDPGPVGGTPVTDATFVATLSAVHAIEAGSVALGDFLIARHQRACGGLSAPLWTADVACLHATNALRRHATEFAPHLLVALHRARDALRLLAHDPPSLTQAQVSQALAELTAAFYAATTWARGQGWTPVAP